MRPFVFPHRCARLVTPKGAAGLPETQFVCLTLRPMTSLGKSEFRQGEPVAEGLLEQFGQLTYTY